ncbi:MAG: hypothetical protein KAR57_07190 [Bacteroidales bacterium]|nr:hypothetical protein [Bacteroidales bacterium]
MIINKIYIFLITGLLFSLNSLGQSRCDTVSEDIILWLEKMPERGISIDELEIKINEVLTPHDFRIENDVVFYVFFIINCKGEDFDYQVYNLDNKIFNEKLIEYLKEFTNWAPPMLHDRSADMQASYSIKVHDNSFNILDEKERRRESRKKRRKK